MNRTFRAAITALILAVSCSGSAAGPFEDGQDAATRDDYATAVRLWRPLADQGNARAQYSLGLIYENSQDYAAAVIWYRKAADQGLGDIPQNVNFAIKASVAAAFLDFSQRVAHLEIAGAGALATPDIADRAKSFTVQVVCVR